MDLVLLLDESVEGGELSRLSTFQTLNLAKEGRALFLGGGDLAAALSLQIPLALALLYEELPPMMSAAVDGDPATLPPRPAEGQ